MTMTLPSLVLPVTRQKNVFVLCFDVRWSLPEVYFPLITHARELATSLVVPMLTATS